MNVLVVAPHPDDDAIGCGGTIYLHAQRGDRVCVVFLTSGELGLRHVPREEAWMIREREAELAGEVLHIDSIRFLRFPDWYLNTCTDAAASTLGPILLQEAPELIYVPHEHEAHPDHQAALSIVRAVLPRMDSAQPTLLTYEVWTPLHDYYHVENVSPVMRQKLAAIRCHRSQIAQLPYLRAVVGLNLYRGATAGACHYAEIFQTASTVPEQQIIRAQP